jgi:transglutaminase/protease-like cytokinesis protein 3
MKNVMQIFLLFIANFCLAQTAKQFFFNTDNIKSPEALAQLLTASDTTDLQKVTSIFKWITENIDYNVKQFENNSSYRYAPVIDEEDDDTTAPLKPLYERVAIQVLKRRTAVCGGYANLFKSLCTHAGIRCEVITGLGKTSAGRLDKRFTSNHRWNAVFFDTAWHLLDVTWASGVINYKDQFDRLYNPYYFLTPSEDFIKDHYPEDVRWTLLPKPPLINEFAYSPFKTTAFNRFYIRSYSPVSGIIDANIGDSIVFELEAERPERLWISDLSYTDSNSVFIMQCCGAIKPVNKIQGNRISAGYKVSSADIEWLHIVYDDEIIMRYKLNVRKENITVIDSLSAQTN